MKLIAFNGSPRKKKWNTVTLLEHALKGAASVGAETELIQLYDLNLRLPLVIMKNSFFRPQFVNFHFTPFFIKIQKNQSISIKFIRLE